MPVWCDPLAADAARAGEALNPSSKQDTLIDALGVATGSSKYNFILGLLMVESIPIAGRVGLAEDRLGCEE